MTTAEQHDDPADNGDPDAVLLAHPGVMRACWWSRCPGAGCNTRIEAGRVQGLARVDGVQKWVCQVCLQRLRPEVARPP